MSQLVARILLTIFMLPAATVVYIFTFVFNDRLGVGNREMIDFLISGATAWGFVIIYWLLLWRKGVQWNSTRALLTLLSALAAIGIGALLGFFAEEVVRFSTGSFGAFLGTMAAPISWLILTVIVWRETPAERRQRIRAANGSAIICPNCGYNLTGLNGTRCPECGSQFTLDELIASQPKAMDQEIEAGS
ncbi:MAG: hypothetical protein JO353_02440 [Phycisphaerae bacterium]|nr:hypothetical protein [Phycisphaerae bacterium]